VPAGIIAQVRVLREIDVGVYLTTSTGARIAPIG